MRIFFTRLAKVRVSWVLINNYNEDVCCSKGEHIIVQTVPLSTHDGEIVLKFLLIDEAFVLVLLVNVVERGCCTVGVSGDHLGGVP
jgi:hypothetical protein